MYLRLSQTKKMSISLTTQAAQRSKDQKLPNDNETKTIQPEL